VAHDFNNLLMVIISGVSFAKRRFGEPESERHLDAAMDAAHRGSELTRQLLVFARQDQLKAESIDLAAVLNSTRNSVRAAGQTSPVSAQLRARLPWKEFKLTPPSSK
jgi:signal transduction histidine kinase